MDKKEIVVRGPAATGDIEIRDGGMEKKAFGRTVTDADHTPSSGKEAYGRSLQSAIDLLWKKVNDGVKVSANNKTSVERAAAYYAMIDKTISDIVISDVTASISDEQIDEMEKMRSEINKKHKDILASVISRHVKPDKDSCENCGAPLFEDKCVVCQASVGADGEMIKNAGSPSLDFYENGFIVGLATDISNYVVTSGFNLNDAVKIARETFDLSSREEYRLRKYLNYMGYMAPQMIWLPASEVRHS